MKYEDSGLTIDKSEEIKPPTITNDPLNKEEDSRLTEIESIFKETAAAPAYTAHNWKEQFVLAKVSGTYYLYVYFADEGVWKRVAVT
jgi:hypothetical protein